MSCNTREFYQPHMHFHVAACCLGTTSRGLLLHDLLSVLDRAVGSFLYPEEVCLPLVPWLLYSWDLTPDICISVGFKRPTAEENVPIRVFSLEVGIRRFELLSLLVHWILGQVGIRVRDLQSIAALKLLSITLPNLRAAKGTLRGGSGSLGSQEQCF